MRLVLLLLITCGWLTAGVSVPADEREPKLSVLRPGVRMSLVAEHPQLATPTGIDVDSEGRIWVVATHTHFRPEDYEGPEHDEILVLTDTNGDGTADRRHVFYNATQATMDLELGTDGWVYLAERSRVLRVRDTDGDQVADVVEDVAVLTTTADYPHNGLEGLAWHPSGDLVFGLGENFAQPWTITGRDGATVRGTGEGGIFRCSADGRELRRIARGFWNPFGICVRDDGQIFAAENDPGERPPCRLLHIVEGGDYGYQRAYGPEAHHPFVAWNGELRGTLPMIHPSGEAPCGIVPLGRGLLVPSWSDHRIDFFLLQPRGASFSAERLALVQGGRYFRPGCIACSPARADNSDPTMVWYLTDWVDGRYQAHGYGRLWKLEVNPAEAGWTGPTDLEPPTEAARLAADLRSGQVTPDRGHLLQLARDEDPFLARAALLALSRLATQWTRDDVARWAAEDRVTAVLAIRLSAAAPEPWVRMFLKDSNSAVQFEILRWIADAQLTAFLPNVSEFLNRSDLDYQRFEAGVAAFNTLSGQPEAGVRNPELLLARVRDSDSAPQLRAFALRLLPKASLAASQDGRPPVLSFPPGLTLELLQQLLGVGDEALSLEVVRTLAGNSMVSQQLLADIATDSRQDSLLRAEAIAGLANVAEQQLPLLLRLAEDSEAVVREEALRALRTGVRTPERIQQLQQVELSDAATAELVRAILEPASLASERPVMTDTASWLALLESIDGTADPERGRRIFHHTKIAQCANCHRHEGRGNVVGPDLSQLGPHSDPAWLLESILQPSLRMAPEYQPRTVVLTNGQTFTGIRLRSSTKEALRDANGQNRTFDRDEIAEMVESPVSFMPEGIASTLTLRELRDLLAFLRQ